ncbi:MAG TPA: hypothetical protein VLJ57_10600 [Burkholderiaceae bacterium]|nr:hypothetical protein [Burkholderiaceae bacterium]
MSTPWLESLEAVATSWIGAVLVVLVVAGQLVAVGVVASEQVNKAQQRELTRQGQRSAVLRCGENNQRRPADSVCPHRVVYVANR